MATRREFIIGSGLIAAFGGAHGGSSWAQTQSRRGDRVSWGGLGFSVPDADVGIKFPRVSAAAKQMGGIDKLVTGFTTELRKNYLGGSGLVYEPYQLLDFGGGLVFAVSLDTEQLITVPNEGGLNEFLLSFVYAQAQVLFLDPPSASGGAGELRILYSFPFRVQSVALGQPRNEADRVAEFGKLLLAHDNSLLKVFSRKVAAKKFRESSFPPKLKVGSVQITSEASETLRFLGVQDTMNESFFGQAFTASTAEQADVSVVPYKANNALGKRLAERFKQGDRLYALADRLGKSEEIDYQIDLTVHRVLRKANGSNIATLLYARGLSVLVKVTDKLRGNKVVFDRKILLIENNELPKSLMDNLKDFDQRYLVQITIKLFDDFIRGVINEDAAALRSAGLEPEKYMDEIKAFKEVLLRCRYI